MNPAFFTTHEWAKALLSLAVLVWLPLALPLVFERENGFRLRREILRHAMLPAAAALAVSLWLPGGLAAGLLALPWMGVTVLIFWEGWQRIAPPFRKFQTFGKVSLPSEIVLAAACIFLPVGGIWALADRLGWQPLGFDAAIVLLTAVHFHYAGFLFPLLAGLAMRHFPNRWLAAACWLAIFSVPMTAAGITFSKFYHFFLVETLAAAAVTLAGWCCAAGYFKLVFSEKLPPAVRWLWLVVAASLVFSMSLALLFALRPWLPLEWLGIPNMRTWHGSVNALGVAGCGVVGWYFFKKEVGKA